MGKRSSQKRDRRDFEQERQPESGECRTAWRSELPTSSSRLSLSAARLSQSTLSPCFARVFRSLIAFGVVFVAYQAYALLVAPAIEPGIKAKKHAPIADAPNGRGSKAVERYQQLLASYLPAGHWSLVGSPKVIESGSMLLVIDDYRRDDRGRVDLTKCVAILFPTDRHSPNRRGGAPQDAVVFEAPGGARLQFDENFEPSRGKVGKIVVGEFPGEITIRSRMSDPGPDDDLLIVARDLIMNETLIASPHEVSIRHGRNRGGGRRLEIKLIEEEGARQGSLKIAGVESIEVFEQVQLELQLGGLNPLRDNGRDGVARFSPPLGGEGLGEGGAPVTRLLPHNASRDQRHAIHLTAYTPPVDAGSADEDAAAWADGPELADPQAQPNQPPSVYARPGRPAQPPRQDVAPLDPPLEVTCAGSFRIDFTDFTATFRDRVRATQLNLNGQSDQLTCNELRLVFGAGEQRRRVVIDPRNEPELANRQKKALEKLQPRRLEAIGNPVKVDSPARGVTARGERLSYDFGTRQLSIAGQRAVIARGESFVQAPLIRYEQPADSANAAIGRMWVAGPGRLRAATSKDRPDRLVEAEWTAAPGVDYPVQLVRNPAGAPVLTVLGRPRFSATGVGELTSDRLTVVLEETDADGPDGPVIELGGDAGQAILAERIDASGRVELDSPRLTASTNELTVWLVSEGGRRRLQPDREAGRSPPRQTAAVQANDGASYRLTAQRTQLEVLIAGGRSEPATLSCDGAVEFRENPVRPGDQPLVVRGERLRVEELQTDAVRLSVHGAAAGGSPTPATIAARGVTLNAYDAHVDQGKNRIWADGAGDAHVRTTRDFLGQQTAAATDLHLKWRGGWVFDGRRITIRDNVLGEGPHDWVRTNELVATLRRPIDLGRGASPGDIEIEQIDCRDGVVIDHRTVDERGQTSHEHAELRTLSVNQETGALSGDGPGWVRSVRLSDGKSPFDSLGRAEPTKPAPTNGGARLALLKVHFHGDVVGNIKGESTARRLQFRQRVRAVYGPVIAWEQDLPVEGQGALPPDTATLSCQQLQVAEDPVAARLNAASLRGGPLAGQLSLGPLELIAAGGVRLEGAAASGGAFHAKAATASYTQAKELFVLQGDSLAKAELWLQKAPGQGALKHTSGKVSYWRKTGIVQTENFGATGYTPTAGRPQPAANQQRPPRR